MTPTPEATAFVAIQFWCDDPEGTDDDLHAILSKLARDAAEAALNMASVRYAPLPSEREREAYLSQAIREAENAAYERAASVASEESIHPLADQIAGAIRSLKSPKEV